MTVRRRMFQECEEDISESDFVCSLSSDCACLLSAYIFFVLDYSLSGNIVFVSTRSSLTVEWRRMAKMWSDGSRRSF